MTLIQTIRAEQVLKEEGLNLPIRSHHREDVRTVIGDRVFKLIFPKFMLNYECTKDIDQIFVGLVNARRRRFLNNFPGAYIVDSKRGRSNDTKAKDEEYFKLMARSRISLCPKGDFKWTYRFFESTIFKSIPVIEVECDQYAGYKYYKLGDRIEYRADWVEHNFHKTRSEMFWS